MYIYELICATEVILKVAGPMSVVPSFPFPALGLITDLVFQPSAWSLSFLSLQFYLVLNHFHPKAALHVRKKKLLLIYVRGY